MNISQLLTGFSIKDYIYGAIIVALVILFITYTVHERHVGAAKVIKSDQKAVATQIQHNHQVENNAKKSIQQAATQYHHTTNAPVRNVPHVLCYAARSGGAVSGHASTASPGNDSTSVPAESTVPFDPAPGILKNDQQADAQVTLLQAYIHACQKAGICKQ